MAPTNNRPLVAWLACVCALLVAMVSVGGITRLTNSGLSMVEWQPLVGALPPLSDDAWQQAFARYREHPQFRLVFPGMDLAGFKAIFFWEYLHRLLGRLIGVAYALPLLIFIRRGLVGRTLALRLGAGLLLGGLQGALGWFMVRSGLVDRPQVSHYRLAAHLVTALLLLSYLLWNLLDLAQPRVSDEQARPTHLRWLLRAFGGLLGLQVIYGAFTAGLHAGLGHNTFPTMDGRWFPEAFFQLEPAWLNPLQNPTAVQFIHRTLAWLVLLSALALWLLGRRARLRGAQRHSLALLLSLTLAQFGLGVATLLWIVPVGLAALHQLGACLLVAGTTWANHAFRAAVAERQGQEEGEVRGGAAWPAPQA